MVPEVFEAARMKVLAFPNSLCLPWPSQALKDVQEYILGKLTFAALIPTLNVARMFLSSSRTLSHFLQVQNFKLLAVPEKAKLDCQKIALIHEFAT